MEWLAGNWLILFSGSHAPAWEPIPQNNDSSVCIPTQERGNETSFATQKRRQAART